MLVVFVGVAAAGIAVERWIRIQFQYSCNSRAFMAKLKKYILSDNIDRAISLCNSKSSALLPKVLKSGLTRAKDSTQDIQNAIDEATLYRRREAVAQITAADGVAITKRDLAHSGAVQAVQCAVATLNPLAAVVPAEGKAFADWLVDREDMPDAAWHARRFEGRAPMHGHPHGVRSVTIRARTPPSWARFAVWRASATPVWGWSW